MIDHVGTGRELAIKLAGRFPQQDWIAELARRAHKSRDFVEWHLQEDLEPPPEILAAAGEMLRERGEPDDGSAKIEGGLLTKDDLPFSGLPGNLGKLRLE